MTWSELDVPRRAVAVYSLDPAEVGAPSQAAAAAGVSNACVLRVSLGDELVVRAETDLWVYCTLLAHPGLFGIVPRSYVVLRSDQLNACETATAAADEEITASLREFNAHLKEHFLSQEQEKISLLRDTMRQVMLLRSSLLTGQMPAEEAKETRHKVNTKIDFLNNRLGLDLIVRGDEGNVLTSKNTSAIELYRQHVRSLEKIDTMMLGKPHDDAETSNMFKILLSVKNFLSSKVNDDVDLIMSVYEVIESRNLRPLCENFVVYNWSRNPIDPRDIDRRNNLRVLFADLCKTDITSKRLFLICNVVNVGTFSSKPVASGTDAKVSKSVSRNDLNKSIREGYFRKPVGVAAVEITDLFTFKQGRANSESGGYETELAAPFIACNDNEPFESAFRKLISEKRNVTGNDSKNLWLTLSIMMGDVSQQQQQLADPTLHHHLLSTPGGRLAIARKIGLPDVILPSDFRNDLYVTLVSGEFSRLDKRSDRNVEVTMEVCNEAGVPIGGAIGAGVCGAGFEDEASSEFRSVVYYHEGKPKWNEVVKVTVPVDEFTGSHLRFTFRHRSSSFSKEKPQPWALAFLKLVNDLDKTAIRDYAHELIVYKIEKKFELEGGSYLQHPFIKSNLYMLKQKNNTNLTPLPKDSFTVQTTLCSTKLTQNEGLLSLLKWRDDPEKLGEHLKVFNQKVNGEEFVKFLPDVLDALFSILTDNKSDNKQRDEILAKVFKSLIKVIHIITEDTRYQQFVPVLDMYIQENFSATLAYDKLLPLLTECIDDATVKPSELANAMKSLRYIFKFIVRSRTLFAKLNPGKGQEPFEKQLHDVLSSMVELMRSPSPEFLHAQAFCLRHMVQAVPDLVTVYDRRVLTEIIVLMIKSLPKGQLTEQRVTTLKDLVHSQLFDFAECRDVLLPELAIRISEVMSSPEVTPAQSRLVALCTDTLGDVIKRLHDLSAETPAAVHTDIALLLRTCLRTVIQSVANRQKGDKVVPGIVANMIALLHIMSADHFKEYIAAFDGGDPAQRLNLVDFVMEVLGMFQDLVQNSVFPQTWMSMILLQNAMLRKALTLFADTIRDYLLDPFESQVWGHFFRCAVTFITQPSLQLEKFSENKRQKLLSTHGDMRKDMAQTVYVMWFRLGQHKIRFIPEMVGPFLEMSLTPETELRKATIPIFFDMMQCEYYSSKNRGEDGDPIDTRRNPTMIKGNFRDFEQEAIERLDKLMESGCGDAHYRVLFRQIMMSSCENHTSLKEPGTRLIQMVTRLMELFLEYRTIVQEDSKENQMSCIVNLIDYYQSIHCDELYVKYLKKLCSLHEACQNWAEAALVLLQYASLLQWSDRALKLGWKKHSMCMTHRALKEQLFRDSVTNLERGKMWERALKVCKELAQQYEEETFEYTKLADLHQKMSGFYKAITRELRPKPEYFRVAFYGRGFPAFLQNKVFVYRGRGFEKLADFSSRMLDQFPKAELLKTLKAPTQEEKEQGLQLLQINNVEPIMSEVKFHGKFVQQQVIDYYHVNEVNRFMYSRPVNKGNNKDNEFANMWIERTHLQTKYTFPGILQWSLLSQPEEVFELCPLENAIETMQKKNEELRRLILEYQSNSPPLNPLTMRLNGILDPAVMGGTAKYEQAFFVDTYLQENPDHQPNVRVLQNLIAEQIPLLEVAIKVHSIKKTDDLKPLHDRFETMFQAMRASVEEKYGKRSCDIIVTQGRGGTGARKSSAAASTPNAAASTDNLRRNNASDSRLLSVGPSAGSNSPDARTSFVSQGSLEVTTPRSRGSGVLSAIGITRKRSNASSSALVSGESLRGSLGRTNNSSFSSSSSTLAENGHAGGAGGAEETSADTSPTVVVTQTPVCRINPATTLSGRPPSFQLMGNAPPSPSHSRSPSVTSNRESVVSNDEGDADAPPMANPPPVPPKSRISDAESASLSSFDDKMSDREEIVPKHIILSAKKKAPPPPPPSDLGSVTPPTLPKKPLLKPPHNNKDG